MRSDTVSAEATGLPAVDYFGALVDFEPYAVGVRLRSVSHADA